MRGYKNKHSIVYNIVTISGTASCTRPDNAASSPTANRLRYRLPVWLDLFKFRLYQFYGQEKSALATFIYFDFDAALVL